MRILVLVVEDEELTRTALERSLRSRSIDVVSAKDLIEASRHIRQRDFQAILLDLSLGPSRGIDTFVSVIGEMRKYDRDAPIVVYTGSIGKDEQDKLEDAGCRIVWKPANTDEIVKAIFDSVEDWNDRPTPTPREFDRLEMVMRQLDVFAAKLDHVSDQCSGTSQVVATIDGKLSMLIPMVERHDERLFGKRRKSDPPKEPPSDTDNSVPPAPINKLGLKGRIAAIVGGIGAVAALIDQIIRLAQ